MIVCASVVYITLLFTTKHYIYFPFFISTIWSYVSWSPVSVGPKDAEQNPQMILAGETYLG